MTLTFALVGFVLGALHLGDCNPMYSQPCYGNNNGGFESSGAQSAGGVEEVSGHGYEFGNNAGRECLDQRGFSDNEIGQGSYGAAQGIGMNRGYNDLNANRGINNANCNNFRRNNLDGNKLRDWNSFGNINKCLDNKYDRGTGNSYVCSETIDNECSDMTVAVRKDRNFCDKYEAYDCYDTECCYENLEEETLWDCANMEEDSICVDNEDAECSEELCLQDCVASTDVCEDLNQHDVREGEKLIAANQQCNDFSQGVSLYGMKEEEYDQNRGEAGYQNSHGQNANYF